MGVQLSLMDALGEAGGAIASFHGSFMSPSAPVWATPLVAGVGHGYDPFSKRPVNPLPWMNVQSQDQRTPYTTTVAIAAHDTPAIRELLAAAGFNTPAKIDFAIRAYTGTLGAEAAQAITSMAKDAGWDDRTDAMPQARAFERAFQTNDMIATEPEAKFRRDFDGYEAAWNSMQLDAERDPTSVKRWINPDPETATDRDFDNAFAVQMYQVAKPFRTQVDSFTALRREFRNMPDIDPDTKEGVVREMTLAIAGVAKTYEQLRMKLWVEHQRARREGGGQ